MSDPKTSVASYAASGSLIFFGMNVNDLAVVVGMGLAIATFIVNWYYKHQQLKLLEARVAAPFPKLSEGGDE